MRRAHFGRPRALGWRPSARPASPRRAAPATSRALPRRVVLDDLPPVEDQDAGDCVVQVLTSAAEYLSARAGVRAALSRRYLRARALRVAGAPLDRDVGMEIADALEALELYGCCLESSWPYSRQIAEDPPDQLDAEADRWRAELFVWLPDLRTQMASVTDGFPVGFGMPLPESFERECAATGRLEYPKLDEPFLGGHSMLKVGYDADLRIGACVGAWLVMNSWGADFGERGFFWMPFRFGERGQLGRLAREDYSLRSLVAT